MTDRFDLEQQILEAWRITDDINMVYEHVMEAEKFDRDDISNLLLGIMSLYNLKFDKLFTTFETMTSERKIT